MVVMVAEFWKLLCFLKNCGHAKFLQTIKGDEDGLFSTGKKFIFHKLAIGLL